MIVAESEGRKKKSLAATVTMAGLRKTIGEEVEKKKKKKEHSESGMSGGARRRWGLADPLRMIITSRRLNFVPLPGDLVPLGRTPASREGGLHRYPRLPSSAINPSLARSSNRSYHWYWRRPAYPHGFPPLSPIPSIFLILIIPPRLWPSHRKRPPTNEPPSQPPSHHP